MEAPLSEHPLVVAYGNNDFCKRRVQKDFDEEAASNATGLRECQLTEMRLYYFLVCLFVCLFFFSKTVSL